MGIYDGVLLTVDYDRTLTGPDGEIPRRNLEAIEYFMAHGGRFTVNTGRSVATFWKQLETIPVNAPFLLYNGSAAYENGQLTQLRPLEMEPWHTMAQLMEDFWDMNLEIQGTQIHYVLNPTRKMLALYENQQWRYKRARIGEDVGPFIKFALFGDPEDGTVASLFTGTPAEIRRFDEAEYMLRLMYGNRVEVFRAAPRIIDVHAKGVSKINAARQLQEKLGSKILVCVGDAENDISMLDGADYAFCPADGVVADRYETVCDCGSGAVADVIYEKIPQIVDFQP